MWYNTIHLRTGAPFYYELIYFSLAHVRTKNNERLDKIKEQISEYGYDPDSILLVVKNPAREGSYLVYDGNTRLLAVLGMPSITQLPCRIITLPPGKPSFVI